MIATIDEVTRWWDEHPCNLRHSQLPTDTLDFSREVTTAKFRAEPHLPGFAQFPRWTGKHVLEVGCGIGTTALEFARSGAEVLALDVSSRAVEITRQRITAEGLNDRIDAQVRDVETPIAPLYRRHQHAHRRIPDLIFSFGVIHHTPHPDRVLRQLHEVADSHTELRVMVYHRWSTKALRLGLTERRVARGSEANPNTPIARTFTRRSLVRLLRTTGWEPQRTWVDHIFPYAVEHYTQTPRRYVRGFPWNATPRPVFRALERVFGWHLLVVARPAGERTR